MTPDRLLLKEDSRPRITQEALLNLSQIARECQINSGRMIANQKNNPDFPGPVLKQVPQIEKRLASLSELLLGLSQNPAAFTLVGTRVVTTRSGVSGHEIILVCPQDSQSRRLYFREITVGNDPQIYAAALEADKLNPFAGNTAVPEISVFPVNGRIKSKFHLLSGGECFSFTPRWVETMGEQKINLLALFVETLAVKLLALKPRLKPK